MPSLQAMKFLAGIFLILASYRASAQASSGCEVFTSVASSDAWVAKVRSLPLKQQVVALRQRMACDTKVRGYVFSPSVCLTCVSAEGQRAYRAQQEQRRLAEAADPRPRGVVLYCMVDDQVFRAGSTTDFQRLVTKNSVKQISLLESVAAVAICGSQASEGAVLITTKKFRPATASVQR
jgi:hypothetical protein